MYSLKIIHHIFQTIDWVMKVEHDFFPAIAGHLGTSMENVQHYQSRLDDFLPVYKVINYAGLKLTKATFFSEGYQLP